MKNLTALVFALLCQFALADDHTAAIANMKARCTAAMDTGLCRVALDPADYTDPRGYFIQGPNRWIPNDLVVGFSRLGFSKDADGGWTMCNLVVRYCTADWDGDGCLLIRTKWRQTAP